MKSNGYDINTNSLWWSSNVSKNSYNNSSSFRLPTLTSGWFLAIYESIKILWFNLPLIISYVVNYVLSLGNDSYIFIKAVNFFCDIVPYIALINPS